MSKFFGGNENCFTGEHCSDVIPLYRPTAREINLMTNSQICRFYVFSFAKCKIDGRASKELFPLNIQYILKAICLIYKKEGYQKLCRAHDYRIFCRLFRGLLVRIITQNIKLAYLCCCVSSLYVCHIVRVRHTLKVAISDMGLVGVMYRGDVRGLSAM